MPTDEPVRWGVLATGGIAESFARDLREVPHAELVAVGSRRVEAARRFAATYGAEGCRAYGDYQALVEDPDVDVVYVATPHSLHLAGARAALAAGKHVLCEKPLTVNAREARELVGSAEQHDRFLMEAMWMACHPLVRQLVDDLAGGRFGSPRQVHADLGFVVDAPADSRMRDPALGAGALLDMGIYPLTLADLALGPATTVCATGVLDERGIDVDVAVAATHAGGAVSVCTASMTSASPRTASIATDEGRLDLPGDFHHPPYAVWTPVRGTPERLDPPAPVLGSGLGNEAAEVGRCLREGLRQSPWVPHDRTLRLMTLMDQVREQIGVRYLTDDEPTQG